MAGNEIPVESIIRFLLKDTMTVLQNWGVFLRMCLFIKEYITI